MWRGGCATDMCAPHVGTTQAMYSIHATYNPGTDYTGSNDNTHTLTVGQAGTTTTAANQTATFGSVDQNVSLSAVVTATRSAEPREGKTVSSRGFPGPK